MFSMDLMSLRRGAEGGGEGVISDFTLAGLSLMLGGGEVEWGGETGGLLVSTATFPLPRALKAEASPAEPMLFASEETGGLP